MGTFSTSDPDQIFRLILLAGMVLVFPVALYYRIRSQATGERLDRRQEGLFILATLRPIGMLSAVGLLAFVANSSWMAWSSVPITRGTGKTFIEGLGHPGYVGKDGVMTPVPHLSKSRVIDFGEGSIEVPRMTWGDVFTAYHSTGIPNIEDYFVVPSMVRSLLKMSRYFRPLMSWDPVQRALKRNISARPPGPLDEEREKTHTVVWGEVEDDQGNTATSRLRGPEGYTFTVLASLAAIQRVILGDAPTGYQTPSSAYGADFVLEVEGVVREDVD